MMNDSLYVLNAYVAIELNKAHKDYSIHKAHKKSITPEARTK